MASVRRRHLCSNLHPSPTQIGLVAILLARRTSLATILARPARPARIPTLSPARAIARLQSRIHGPSPVNGTAPANIPATSPAKAARPSAPLPPLFQRLTPINDTDSATSPAKTSARSTNPATPPARHHPLFQATPDGDSRRGKSSSKKTATRSAIRSTIHLHPPHQPNRGIMRRRSRDPERTIKSPAKTARIPATKSATLLVTHRSHASHSLPLIATHCHSTQILPHSPFPPSEGGKGLDHHRPPRTSQKRENTQLRQTMEGTPNMDNAQCDRTPALPAQSSQRAARNYSDGLAQTESHLRQPIATCHASLTQRVHSQRVRSVDCAGYTAAPSPSPSLAAPARTQSSADTCGVRASSSHAASIHSQAHRSA